MQYRYVMLMVLNKLLETATCYAHGAPQITWIETTSVKNCINCIFIRGDANWKIHQHNRISLRLYTNKTAFMHPSFSGLFVTWAYLPATQEIWFTGGFREGLEKKHKGEQISYPKQLFLQELPDQVHWHSPERKTNVSTNFGGRRELYRYYLSDYDKHQIMLDNQIPKESTTIVMPWLAKYAWHTSTIVPLVITPREAYIVPFGFFFTEIMSRLKVHFSSGWVTWALVKRRPVGRTNRSYFGGFLVNPAPTKVALVTILFHCLAA